MFFVNHKGVEDSIDLLHWMANINVRLRYYKGLNSGNESKNNAHLIGQVTCKMIGTNIWLHLSCSVSTLSIINYCEKCPSLILST